MNETTNAVHVPAAGWRSTTTACPPAPRRACACIRTTTSPSSCSRGAVEFFRDGVRVQGAEGDALHVPRGVPHAFRVASDEGARLLGIGTPAGHERFFQQAGDPLETPAPPDLGRMAEAAAAAGFELLGPPPF
jgi:hypothetical protein